MNIVTVTDIIGAIEEKMVSRGKQGSVLVAITGIDASGKSTLARFIYSCLRDKGFSIAVIHLDDWRHLTEVQFNRDRWAEHYYENAYRFDELFSLLIFPIKRNRSVYLTIELPDAIEDVLLPRTFNFNDVDVIILEGIFLLKSEYRKYYDLAFWVDCPFQTALKRAIQRNQEGVSEQQLLFMYYTIFFPAQRLHILRDNPVALADAVLLTEDSSNLSYRGIK